MSPKECSLAWDDLLEEEESVLPEKENLLKLVIPAQGKDDALHALLKTNAVIEISGRVTVSF